MKNKGRFSRVTAVLLSLLLVCSAAFLPARAAEIDGNISGAKTVEVSGLTYGDFEYSVNDDGMVTITGYTGSAAEVTIPKTIDGKSVTSIGNSAFKSCTSLTSITIPDSVKSIDWSAFYGCESLTSITIPDSVTSIGGYAFSYCTSLTSITIPDSVTSIASGALSCCTSLTNIEVSTNNVNFKSVDGILYDKNVKTLIACPGGKTDVTIPDSVTSIGEWAFSRCTSLTSITIPNSVTSIGDCAFSDCTSLTSITIPDGVTSIGEWAFSYCTSLTSITIPDSVTSIGYYAFSGCTSLTDVYYTGTEEQWNNIIIYYDNDSLKNANRHYVKSLYCSVIWKNTDGTVLETDNNVEYGTIPTYDGEIPSKERTAQYSYSFDWDKEVTMVTGDATYTAVFTPIVNKYTVTWKNEDKTTLKTDTVEYGTTPTYDGNTPTKAKTAQYTYTFSGWDKEITAVTEDVTYTAEFTRTINTYTVKWKDFDGTVLETDNNVAYGMIPTYDGEIPTRLSDSFNSYTFKGWDKEITAVTGDVTYTAQWDKKPVSDTSTDTATDTGTDTTDDTSSETDTDSSTDIQSDTSADSTTDTDNDTDTSMNDDTDTSTDISTDEDSDTSTNEDTDTSTETSADEDTDTSTDVPIDTEDTYTDSDEPSSPDEPDVQPDEPKQEEERSTAVDDSTDEDAKYLEPDFEPPVTDPNDFDYNKNDDGTYSVVRYKGSDKAVTIPSEHDGKPVTGIVRLMKYKDERYSHVIRIFIPDTVTEIGSKAFADYTGLKIINIPDRVKKIGDNAFYNCASLTSLDISEGVTQIGVSTFSNCTALEKITIPDSVTKIGQSAFYQCENLKEITLSSGMTKIEMNTFAGCINLETITIPESITEIGYKVFEVCQSLKDVYYGGTEEQWNNIKNESNTGFLKDATIHFMSSTPDNTTTETPDTPEVPRRMSGDVDGDGKVSAKDSMLIQRYVIKLKQLDDVQLMAADVNGDDKISNKDALDILRFTIHMSKNEKIGNNIS